MDVHKLSTKEVGPFAKRLVAAKIEEMGASTDIPKGNKSIILAKPGAGR